jgi:hypothetical protein
VLLTVTLRPGDHPILEVSVSAAGKEALYLVDPRGGALRVKADGGHGGSGGRGGSGGKGGFGGIGTPSGRNGLDGYDGRRGWSGRDGKGGSVRVVYDPQAKAYLDVIHLSNWNGPVPTFQEEHVAELW